jgi:hypothetical protein
LKKRRAIVLGVVLAVLSICIYEMRDRVHFDWYTFGQQLKLADWKLLAVATMLTWLTYGTDPYAGNCSSSPHVAFVRFPFWAHK